MLIFFELLLLMTLVGTAIAVALTKKNLTAIIIFTTYSLVMSLVWIILKSPDLAVTEAAVGAGITSLLFYIVLNNLGELEEFKNKRHQKKKENKNKKSYNFFGILFSTCIVALLLITVNALPPYGGANNPAINEVFHRYVGEAVNETGSLNIVAAVILDYRAFDTFGEAVMLFTAAIAVLTLLKKDENEVRILQGKVGDDEILKIIVEILFPFLIMLGIYVVFNGHLSPGGGFSGGTILGAGLILYSTAFGFEGVKKFFTFKTFTKCISFSLIFYALAKGYSFITGAAHIDSGIPLGTPGNILSGGLILPLNIAVGIVVACTIYGLYALFTQGDI